MQWRHWHSSYDAQYIQAQSRNPRKEETVWEGQACMSNGKSEYVPVCSLEAHSFVEVYPLHGAK